jgi:hypothetical protein
MELGKETELSGTRHRFGTVGDVGFAIDTGPVCFDSARGDKELPGFSSPLKKSLFRIS